MALNFNICLAELRVAGNAGGNEAARFMAEAIKRHATLLRDTASLRKLDLSQNRISDVGAEALARALQHNTLVTLLCLDDNDIRPALAESIQFLASRNASNNDSHAVQGNRGTH